MFKRLKNFCWYLFKVIDTQTRPISASFDFLFRSKEKFIFIRMPTTQFYRIISSEERVVANLHKTARLLDPKQANKIDCSSNYDIRKFYLP